MSYKCSDHHLNLVCQGCMMAWIARHNRMKDFLFKMIEPLKDRDDYFESWQEDAKELLNEIGEL